MADVHNGALFLEYAQLRKGFGISVVMRKCNPINHSVHEELDKTAAQLNALIQASPLAIVVLDTFCRVICWNPAAERIFGWTKNEVLGQLVPYVPSECQEEFDYLIHKVLEGVSFAGFETRGHRKDGTLLPVSISWAPMVDDSNGVTGVIGVIEDISGRKQAENELKKSEERLELALEASGAALWDWDVSTGIGYFSPKCYNILGYETNEVPPTFDSWRNLVHPDDRPQLVENVQKHMAEGEPFFNGTYRVKHKTNQYRWIHLCGRLLVSELNEYTRITGMFIDVTQKVEAEKALKESQQRFQEIFTLSPIGIQLYDANGILREANQAALELFGAKREDIVDMYNVFNDPIIMKALKKQLDEFGSMVHEYEYDFEKVKGFGSYPTSKSGIIYLKVLVTPLGDRIKSSIQGYIVQIQDVTAEKEAAKETLRQSARTEALLRTASRMNLSLELNEVLYSVSMETVKALHADMASVSLYDATSDEFYHVTGCGLPEFFTEQNVRVRRQNFEKYLDPNDPVFVIPDVQMLNGPHAAIFAVMHVRTIVSTPIYHNGEFIGSLSIFFTHHVKEIESEEKILLQGLADQAGMAMVNALLFREVQSNREQLKEINNRVITAQEEERQRISRELHDEAGQALTALKIHLQLIEGDLSNDSDSLRSRLSDAVELTGQTLEQIRTLAQTLRPPALDALGINLTLEDYCREYARRIRIPVEYSGVELPSLPDAVNITLYRFLQEALTNVAKHAKAKRISVRMEAPQDWISLSVCDDGKGFSMSGPNQTQGMGLLGMRERLETLGGRLEIQTEPESGTCITAYIPWGGRQ